MPGTKNILDKLVNNDFTNLTSFVMCFEDAISEKDLEKAESNVLHHLHVLSQKIKNNELMLGDVPLFFVRVRNLKQFTNFIKKLNHNTASLLTGFVFPKFSSSNASHYLDELSGANEVLETKLYGMPILEGASIAFLESRVDELLRLKKEISAFDDLILNLRIGGTDFSSIFGVRRGINTSIYDILPVRDCISDILNFFTRQDVGYCLSAPVWEYFLADSKDDLSKHLDSNLHHSLLNRKPILNDAIDGLLREVLIDKSNGFVGKTVIHPSHLTYVNGMQSITKEEYEDAFQILNTKGGVIKSLKSNKMNEINPHKSWATEILAKADAYGVIEDESHYLELFSQ
jgi:citrate lyase beta subunit